MALRSVPVGVDSPAFGGPMLYYGGLLVAGAGGAATVEVHDGNSAQFPRLDAFRAAASAVDRSRLPLPIYCMRGIFVDVGANVTEFVLYYDDDVSTDTTGPAFNP